MRINRRNNTNNTNIWRTIPGFPHEISNTGQVRRKISTNIKEAGELLTPDPKGRHLFVNITVKTNEYEYDGKAYISFRVSIAALMLKLFGIQRPSEDHHIAYIDGNKHNLILSNITWATGDSLKKFYRKATHAKRGPHAYNRIPNCVRILRFVLAMANKQKVRKLSDIKFDKPMVDTWLKGTVKPYQINNSIDYMIYEDILLKSPTKLQGKAVAYIINPELSSELEVWQRLAKEDCFALVEYGINEDYEDTKAISITPEVIKEALKEPINIPKSVYVKPKIVQKKLKINKTGNKPLDLGEEDEYSTNNVNDFLTGEDLIEEVYEED